MAEIQQNNQSGEMAARFIEFVMMQAQNASLFLGLIPNPSTGQPEVNLDLARLFIDQLAMIQDKTRGNLSSEESAVLRNALTQLQMAFVESSTGKTSVAQVEGKESASKGPAAGAPEAAAAPASAPDVAPAPSAEDQPESRKRFTKSYGA